MRKQPLESVAEAQRSAAKRLPRSVYEAVEAGLDRGASANDNVTAFGELGFAPHVADLPEARDMATTVMGVSLSLPVLLSPAGVQAIHPEGEVAAARAAANRGTTIGLSSFASRSIEDVAAANRDVLFQMYWVGSREAMTQRIERARAAGARGLILTLDWSFGSGRDRGSPAIPAKLDLPTMVRYLPQVLPRLRWLGAFAHARRLPDLTAPNLSIQGAPAPTIAAAYEEWMQTPLPTWRDVVWLREQWGGPFMLKGVMRVDDARRAVDAGVTAISVSNHGGNNLDGTPAPIRALASIAQAVTNDVEVVLDGGVRRGSDVVKAVALGARAVMIGRPYLWGLAVNGQTGVEQILDVLRRGIDSTLLAIGQRSIHEISPSDVVVPRDFYRALGLSES